MPENSGVIEALPLREVSSTALALTLPRKPGLSSGRGVRMLIDEPMPPEGIAARPVL